ncbi:MAG TPA: hypothetical protein VHA33_05700 [Candidatus Angelobacter sp.]|jgi:hypothetical protein|nr:hypothetical protein [Candidatus Angelobacter sp.]
MKRRSTSARKARTEARKVASPRSRHHLIADVTPEEKQAILKYCETHNLSVSRFLAQVALDDASAKKKSAEHEPLTITIKLPASQRAKLSYMARLKEKSIEQLVQEFLAPSLAKTPRGPASRYTLSTESLRFYLSDQEHALILKHMEKEQVSSRHYLAQLALQVIEERGSRRRPK